MPRSELRGVALLVAALAPAMPRPSAAQPASFQGLGDLPGGIFDSRAQAVSADGAVVVGKSRTADGEEAFVWTAAAGMTALGRLPASSVYSEATGVSPDGSTVVGGAASGTTRVAFRWTQAAGMVAIGGAQGFCFGHAYAAFSGGAVGQGCNPSQEAFRWTPAGGISYLGQVPGGAEVSYALGASADGNVVVGYGPDAAGSRAFAWTPAGGMNLIPSPPGFAGNQARGVSGDGTVVVGASYAPTGNGAEAFRWTAAGGPITLGQLPGGFQSWANAASADGRLIVGYALTDVGSTAMVWEETAGMRSVVDVLVASGVDMTGWRLFSATGVSADGTVMVGFGFNPSGQWEAWRAVLPRGIAVTTPGLLIGGERYRISWAAPDTTQFVNIVLLPDTLGAGPLSVDVLVVADSSGYTWTVPDTLFSRSARLVVHNSSNPAEADTSGYFRLRPYHLARLRPNGRYDRYLPSRHGWPFANTRANLFPASWFGLPQFNYSGGVDPFTGLEYDYNFDDPPIRGYPGAFPDWPSFVRAFGTDAAYVLRTPVEAFYRSSFTQLWGGSFGNPVGNTGTNFRGSCFGLSTASLMAFVFRDAFGVRYPIVGPVDRLFGVPLSVATREIANELYSYQFGAVNVATTTATLRSTDPRRVLSDLKTLLLADDQGSQQRNLTIYGVTACSPNLTSSGAHTLTPYRLQRDPSASGRWFLHVYDSNRPADDSTAFIRIDSTANTWFYNNMAGGAGWGNASCGMILEDRIENYLPLAIPPLVGSVPARAGGDSLIVRIPAGGDVALARAAGGSVGHAAGVPFNSIDGAVPLVPKVGGEALPDMYVVPRDGYTVTLDEPAGGRRVAWFEDGDVAYGFGRTDAAPGDADVVRFIPDGGLVAGAAAGGARAVALRAIVAGAGERTLDAMRLGMAAADSVRFEATEGPAGTQLRLENEGGATTYTLQLMQSDDGPPARFRHAGVSLAAGATHVARPDWSTLHLPGATVPVDIDLDGDGIPEETIVLENQPVGTAPAPAGLPTEVRLHGPSPNPSAGGATVRFDLPRAGVVNLAVYDPLGRRVATLADAELAAGIHSAPIPAGLAPGAYVLRLTTGVHALTATFSVVR